MRSLASMSPVTAGLFAMALFGAGACGGATDQHATEHGDDERHTQGVVRLEAGDLADLGIRVEVAGPGLVENSTELPGEVQVNGDRMAHVAPRVSGVVKEVFASLGDSVRGGQVLAVLEAESSQTRRPIFWHPANA